MAILNHLVKVRAQLAIMGQKVENLVAITNPLRMDKVFLEGLDSANLNLPPTLAVTCLMTPRTSHVT